MANIVLPHCHYFGPGGDRDVEPSIEIPADAADNPFAFLPPLIELTDQELELARRYDSGDMSGGYFRSQIAHFRNRISAEKHDKRRDKLGSFIELLSEANLTAPETYLALAKCDDYCNRLRHGNIWLMIPSRLIPLPADPNYMLAQIFWEGQGCGYWHLLLGNDGFHRVCFTEEPLERDGEYPSRNMPDISAYTFYECAKSFDEWLVFYFLDIQRGDQRNDEFLVAYPGI